MKTTHECKNGLRIQLKQHLAIKSGVRLLCLGAMMYWPFPVRAHAETTPVAIPFSVVGAKATVDYQGDVLGITANSDGACLRCGFQKLHGRATPEGLWLKCSGPGTTSKLRLVATVLRREGNLTANSAITLPATGTVSVEDKLVRFARPSVTEEYSVSVDGVRQDFVIARPPAGAGDLRV